MAIGISGNFHGEKNHKAILQEIVESRNMPEAITAVYVYIEAKALKLNAANLDLKDLRRLNFLSQQYQKELEFYSRSFYLH